MSLSGQHSGKPTRVRFGVLAFVSSLSILTYLDRTCISRVQDHMKSDLGMDDVQMGLVFGAFSLGYGLFEVPGGWMGDVWGARRVLTRIVLWWSLFTGLTGTIGWFTEFRDYRLMLFGWELPVLFASMMLVRFLFGCGEAGAYPNVARIVGAWFPFRERGLALGTVWMCARVGGAIAPVIMGLFTTVIGWQQAFWVLGLVGILWCLVFRPWYRNSPGQMPSCNEAERELIHGSAATATQAAAPERHTFPPLGPILASPSMWALCTAAVFVNLAWYFFPTWQPRYLKDVFGISMKDSEIWTGLPYLCGAIGCLAGGRLSDYLIRVTGSRRWGRALLGLTGFCGAGLCAFCVPLASQAWEAVTLLCLVFFITDLAVPVMWAASTDISGRFAGTITAIVNTAGCIGAFLGPALTGARLQLDTGPSHQTWQLIFTGLAGAWVIAGLCWLFIDASRPIVPQETAPKT